MIERDIIAVYERVLSGKLREDYRKTSPTIADNIITIKRQRQEQRRRQRQNAIPGDIERDITAVYERVLSGKLREDYRKTSLTIADIIIKTKTRTKTKTKKTQKIER